MPPIIKPMLMHECTQNSRAFQFNIGLLKAAIGKVEPSIVIGFKKFIHHNVGVLFNGSCNRQAKEIDRNSIVGIKKRKILAAHSFKTADASTKEPSVILVFNIYQPMALALIIGHNRRNVSRRRIINNNHFNVLIGLSKDTFETRRQIVFGAIYGYNHRNQRIILLIIYRHNADQ
ncbi:hypothetical protein GPA_00210 [Gordonibacter pamelaeae 7-10-1-b]|uniref:Uncharacterized protein n=1 Tax=Gordonibacter pamelaeae 7-10-1-b TaxID=657308 RepID=D6E691_9ACTN|nr:hypothetical protein GPA_00210 [Gordonibacter pamelaeae 7-10-1-b]